jgi:hypothetical protein
MTKSFRLALVAAFLAALASAVPFDHACGNSRDTLRGIVQ